MLLRLSDARPPEIPRVLAFRNRCNGVCDLCYATCHVYDYLGITLNSVSAKRGAMNLPGPGNPSQLPAKPLSSQLLQAHLAVVIKNVMDHILPGQPCTLRPVSRLNDTSNPQPTPDKMKNPLKGPIAGTGDIDNSPNEWYAAERMKTMAVVRVVSWARPRGYRMQFAMSKN